MPANTVPETGSARSRIKEVSSLLARTLPVPHAVPDHCLAVTVRLSPQSSQALPALDEWVSQMISNTLDVIFSTVAECSGCWVAVSNAVPDHFRVLRSAPASCTPNIISLELGRAAN